MVCNRCKMVVNIELEKLGIHSLVTDLGEIQVAQPPTKEQMAQLNTA